MNRLRLLAATMPLAALLATACGPAQTGAASSSGPARQPTAPPPSSTADCNSLTTCYTPQQLQVAYGIKPLLDRGINGRGETVVLPELAESQPNPPQVTDMRQDMAAFDRLFHLPAARMRVVTTLAGARSPWLAFGEEALDVEMVHALAPDATLVILLVPSTSLDNTSERGLRRRRLAPTRQHGRRRHVDQRRSADRRRALREPRPGQQRERGTPDGRQPPRDGGRRLGRHRSGGRTVRCLRGAGRTGTFTPVKEVNLLASDPLVLGACGTSLTASHTTGAWQGETAWGLPDGDPGSAFQASGGGFSRLYPPARLPATASPASPPGACPTCRRTPAATSTSAWSSAMAAGA